MLSYLHSFHAGNHADILKHVTLLYTLQYFNKKDKPYAVFDTHSGRGLYDIKNECALKTGEAAQGIGRLLETASNSGDSQFPSELNDYLNFVKKSLEKGFYPGSPAIEKAFIKPGSALFLTELHKTEAAFLSEHFGGKNGVHISNSDGFSFLKSNVPPAQKRGFILCDPSYEEKSDYYNAAQVLSFVHKKWSGATILLWYPLLKNREEEIENMKAQLFSTVKNRDFHTEVLDARLLVDTPDSHTETSLEESIGSARPRLYGSAILAVNPCWGLKEHLESILPFLSKTLEREEGCGDYSVVLE